MPIPLTAAFSNDCPSFTVSQPVPRTCRTSPDGAAMRQTLALDWLE